MKGFWRGVLFAAVIFGVSGLAAYSLGAVGGKFHERVKSEQYAGGDIKYTGSLLEGKFDGFGELAYADGSLFQGEFKEGRILGHGDYISAEGWRFSGLVALDGVSSCKYTLADGAVVSIERFGDTVEASADNWGYSGRLGDRGQNGEGTFTFSDGSRYKGRFVKGLAEGVGELLDSDGGVIYRGGFKAGLFDGHGIYYKDGEAVEGVWAEGVLQK